MSAIFTDYYRTGSTDWYVADVRNLQDPISTGGLNWYPERSNLALPTTVMYQNSTIYSYAMYLLIHGGYHHRAGQKSIVGLVTIPHILVTAQPVNAVKAVLLGAIFDISFNNAKFTAPNMKARMVARAYSIYGATMAQEVGDAWTAVGVGYNCSGPPPVPQYQVWPGYCKGRHTITWTAQPGVKYHGEIRPTYLGWAFAGITSVDGAVSQCKVNPPERSMYHMRACNGCGCSDWAPEQFLDYWNTCQ